MDKPPTTSDLSEEQKWLWTINEQDLLASGSVESLNEAKKKKKKKEDDEETESVEKKRGVPWRLINLKGQSKDSGGVQKMERKRKIPQEGETTREYDTKRTKYDENKLFKIWRQNRERGQMPETLSVQRMESQKKQKIRKEGERSIEKDTKEDKQAKKAEDKARRKAERQKRKEERKKKAEGGAGDKKGVVTTDVKDADKVDDELTLKKGKKKPTMEDLEKPLEPIYTGLFNDERRRIDLILVIEEEDKQKAQEMKAQFLVNMAKLGLEMEFEHGTMPRHKDTSFVKVHAPDKLLYENAEWYGVEKYFKDKNIDFLGSTFLHRLLKLHYEKEWIKLVRKDYQPFKYSNMVRSYIVFMLLRDTPFGQPDNYTGLERLLDNKVIIDAYALHDSSYLYLQDQNYAFVTGRQILYYYWAGVKNMLKLQPVHLIHEYYGSKRIRQNVKEDDLYKIAFYFAFYEFYIQSMFVLSVFGIFKMVPVATQTHMPIIRKDVCNSATHILQRARHRLIAPQCFDERQCPIMTFSDHCFRVKAIDSWDNELFPWYSFYVSLWAVVFPFWWKRKELYLKWAWELFHRPQYIVRTKHYYDYKQNYEPSSFTLMKNYDVLLLWLKRLAIKFFAFTACGLSILLTVLLILFLKYTIFMPVFLSPTKYSEEQKETDREAKGLTTHFMMWYLLLLVFGVGTLALLMVLEKLASTMLVHRLAKMDNHRSQEEYEKNLSLNCFALKAYCTFLPLIIFAWLKGPQLLRVPHSKMDELSINMTFPNSSSIKNLDVKTFKMFTMFHCSLGTCFDEVMILFIVLVFAHIIVTRFFQFFNSLKEAVLTSTGGKNRPPEWESEYLLKPVTDEIIFDKFNNLALQFALVTWFVPMFPIAPAIAMLLNLWHIRYEAKLLIVNSRRPVLFRTNGIGPWNRIITIIGCSAAFFVVMLLVHQSSYAYERILKNYARIADMDYYHDKSFLSGGMFLYDDIYYFGSSTKVQKVALKHYLFSHYKKRKARYHESSEWPYELYRICRHDFECRSHLSEFKRAYNAFTFIIFQLSIFTVAMMMRYYITETPSDAVSLIQAQTHIRKLYQDKRKKLPANIIVS